MSRGGLRAILDDDTGKVELGEEYVIFVGSTPNRPDATAEPLGKLPRRRGRIVWLQEEPDGFVVGVEYIGLVGYAPAALVGPGEQPRRAAASGRASNVELPNRAAVAERDPAVTDWSRSAPSAQRRLTRHSPRFGRDRS